MTPMESKSILIGIVLGIIVGGAGAYFVRMRVYQDEIDALKEVIDAAEKLANAKDEVIAANNMTIISLQYELDAAHIIVDDYEKYRESAENMIQFLNYKCAVQTYRAEYALYLLHGYLPEYEPVCDVQEVYGALSFEEWWEIYGGLYDEWIKIVYP